MNKKKHFEEMTKNVAKVLTATKSKEMTDYFIKVVKHLTNSGSKGRDK